MPPMDGPTQLSRRRLASLALGGCAAAAFGQKALAYTAPQPIFTSDDGLIVGQVGVPVRDGTLPAYSARPAPRGRYPVIIVLSEALGVNEYIRDVCRRLARLGYFAVAPELFYRAGDPARATQQGAIQRIVASASNEQVMSDIGAVIDWAKEEPAAQKRFGVIGFSWGGAPVWMAAQRFKAIRAGVAWYGRLRKPGEGMFLSDEVRPWPLDIVPTLRAPVLGLYAGRDPSIPSADIVEMNDSLAAAGKRGSTIIVYERAEHGFHDDYLPAYNAAAATDGWGRMIAHLERNGLRGNIPKEWRQ